MSGGLNAVAVLQVRTGSSRLPGKAFLPLGGVPLAALAGLRAANTGLELRVATSTDPSDDALHRMLSESGLSCFRGPLDDVLGRFVAALEDKPDDTVIVRLTGDNALPDGAFIEALIEEFHRRGLHYIAANAPGSGLPPGLSAEAFRLKDLRTADWTASSRHEREHVTPGLIRRFGCAGYEGAAWLGMAHYRATVDNLDDYLALRTVFEGQADPVGVSWLELVRRLPQARYQPLPGGKVAKMALDLSPPRASRGVAGLARADRMEIARTALSLGVEWLDATHADASDEATARALRDSGWAGRCRIVTGLSALDGLEPEAPPALAAALAEISVLASCRALGVRRIDTLALRGLGHLTGWSGAVLRRLRELVEDGVIERLGVSVRSPDELSASLSVPDIRHIALPYDMFDWRWDVAIEGLEAARGRRGITVHARSAFLQGLLPASGPETQPIAGRDARAPARRWLETMAGIYGRDGVADLALAHARAQPWIDAIVIGVDDLRQLESVARLFLAPPLTGDQIAGIRGERPSLRATASDRGRWGVAP